MATRLNPTPPPPGRVRPPDPPVTTGWPFDRDLTLYELEDRVKSGDHFDEDTLWYGFLAMCAYANRAMALVSLLSREKGLSAAGRKRIDTFHADAKRMLALSPRESLGDNVPGNEVYDREYRAGRALVDAALAGTLRITTLRLRAKRERLERERREAGC